MDCPLQGISSPRFWLREVSVDRGAGVTSHHEVTVEGMTCEHCVKSVTTELMKIDSVTDVNVDLATGRVNFSAESDVETAAVRSAIIEAGYELVS